MDQQHRRYRRIFTFMLCVLRLFYTFEYRGRENIPEGGALICSNHSKWLDPFFLTFAYGFDTQLHIMAKVELFRIPGLRWFLKRSGTYSVDRSIMDFKAIRTSLSYLKNGEKIAIFPEGTRASEDDVIAAKRGAVKLADRSGCPIVPTYIPRKKGLFRKITIVIGKPYYVNPEHVKLSPADYTRLSDEMMEKIKLLKVK